MRVAITCLQLQRDIDQWRDVFLGKADLVIPEVRGQRLEGADLVDALADVDGVIAGDDVFDRDVLVAVPKLRVISKWGVGVDGIDLSAAQALGVVVRNTPNTFSDVVADVAYGYLILLSRHLHVIDREVRNGGWPKVVGTSLAGRTLGIIGFGSIGREIARRGRVSKMTVLGVDPSPVARQAADALGIELVGLEQVLEVADFLVLSCALTEDSYHLIGAEELSRVSPGVRIVNVGRGHLIDEDALIDALQDGRVAGVALEVMEQEPLAREHRLTLLPQVILGSHNASNTWEACATVHELAIKNLLDELGL